MEVGIDFKPVYLPEDKGLRKEYPPFSVAMSVYKNDNPKWFDIALKSVINQTVKPSEIVLVVDGPIPDQVEAVIKKYENISKWDGMMKVIRLPQNQGLGNALKIAISAASFEYIARMDSDDMAVKDRFEQQLDYLVTYPEVSIIGGDIAEFLGDELNIIGKREVPVSDKEIRRYIKKRCPFNHMTVMYKKSAVEASGGYKDWFWNEDYYLWLRMLQSGCVMANTGTVLVKARIGKEMYQRRGGMKYFKSEYKLQKYMLQNNIIGMSTFLINTVERLVVQVLLPNKIRGWVFRKFARKNVS